MVSVLLLGEFCTVVAFLTVPGEVETEGSRVEVEVRTPEVLTALLFVLLDVLRTLAGF